MHSEKTNGACDKQMKNDINTPVNGQKTKRVSDIRASRPTSSASVHSITQKSKTLYRQAIQKPVSRGKNLITKVGRNMDIARSKSISHFGPSTVIARPTQKPAAAKTTETIMPTRHPIATKVDAIRSTNQQHLASMTKTATEIKETAINEAFKKLDEHREEGKATVKRHFKFVNTASIIISTVLLLIIGYFIYINMPVLSVRVASAQAGINATFPEYHPDGYSLSGPVSYSDGEVTINFRSNTNNSKFVINQSRSSWDSTAVKNQIAKDSNNSFVTTSERGLTIYTYGGNAAWVNGGILYRINGDATLSGDQIRRIASSL